MKRRLRYTSEWNRVVGDNVRLAASMLRKTGIEVDILPHKTALSLQRPWSMSWREFKAAIRSVLQPRRGSVLLFSEATGKTFVCSNRGNNPGRFLKV